MPATDTKRSGVEVHCKVKAEFTNYKILKGRQLSHWRLPSCDEGE
ncbi:hypothetical protein CLOSTHATH_02639 [Hungatella hathewayi DSM 13479]|uniref:Uncharacterized protein n=1 Tax=Hungatella hathewayi DSM 13479 TaxID=566550 RepID=D3AGA3_9FIRM|nr:hypothetical protein CLOSTHATH_02639 [Hungatella hathewayi DSM 13479]